MQFFIHTSSYVVFLSRTYRARERSNIDPVLLLCSPTKCCF